MVTAVLKTWHWKLTYVEILIRRELRYLKKKLSKFNQNWIKKFEKKFSKWKTPRTYFLIEREGMYPLPNRMLITVSFRDNLFFHFNTSLYKIIATYFCGSFGSFFFLFLGVFGFLATVTGGVGDVISDAPLFNPFWKCSKKYSSKLEVNNKTQTPITS